jgi:hypothetical protein
VGPIIFRDLSHLETKQSSNFENSTQYVDFDVLIVVIMVSPSGIAARGSVAG